MDLLTPPPAPPLRGRFAPTPSGPLHLGSLYTALASFLDVRHRGGTWLVRIDDLDPERSRPEHTSSILRTLERFGLLWDETPVRQSARLPLYECALAHLGRNRRTYPCRCTRKELRALAQTGRYPNLCRNRLGQPDEHGALRLWIPDEDVCFDDLLQGHIRHNPQREGGDFIVRRRDDVPAYHLATVVDDADQGITEILRGADLIECTPEHLVLQSALGLPRPSYLHVPVLLDASGRKLSKQNSAPAVDARHPGRTLHTLLALLGQNPPATLRRAMPAELISWARLHWHRCGLPKGATLLAPS